MATAKKQKKPLALDDRETAAVLAGLRLFQQAGEKGLDMDIWDIATNSGETERLGDDEIDALCEKLNLSEG
jgi:hypothetical protein